MKKDNIDITLLVDRSGSMASLRDDVIAGLNIFVENQKKLPGTATLNVYQFDNTCDVVIENKNLNEVDLFTDKDFVPRGGTALYDAMAKVINDRGKYFTSLQEKDRPEKVLIAIFTDGYENSSTQFNKTKVFDMVRHQEEKYSWEVIYLGADQDAMVEGGNIGVMSTKTMGFEKTSGGLLSAVKCASTYTANYRSGKAEW